MEGSKVFSLLKPSLCSLGYALFLAVNATGIWGGVFPFLPMEIQTSDVMFWFYLAQSVMLFVTFSAVGYGSVFFGELRFKSSTRVIFSAAVYFAGWGFLIAGMYLSDFVLPLTVVGGVFLGTGAGLFYLLWQTLFASRGQMTGLRDLVVGFIYAALIYAALYLIPRAITAYLIPLVFLPLFALVLILGNRTIDYTQPMFSDAPRENLRVYRRALSSMWRSALCMGALAFCAGIVRSIAIEQPEVGSVVNLLSMGALLVFALMVLLLWSFKGLRMNLIKLYRIVLPLLITAFLILPFMRFGYVRWLAAGLFALYSIGLMLTMLQCAQISHDRGVMPTFAFGLFGGIVYGLHDLGFIIGYAVEGLSTTALSSATVTALLAIYLLSLMFFIGSVNFKSSAARFFYGDTIELVAPVDRPEQKADESRTAQSHAQAPEQDAPETSSTERGGPAGYAACVAAGDVPSQRARGGGRLPYRARLHGRAYRRRAVHLRKHGAHAHEAHIQQG